MCFNLARDCFIINTKANCDIIVSKVCLFRKVHFKSLILKYFWKTLKEFIVLLQTFYSVMTMFQLLSCLPSKWWKVFLSCLVNFGSLTQIFPKTLENVSLFFWLKIINKEKWTDLFDLFIGLWLISINCLLGCHKWSKFYIFARQIPII